MRVLKVRYRGETRLEEQCLTTGSGDGVFVYKTFDLPSDSAGRINNSTTGAGHETDMQHEEALEPSIMGGFEAMYRKLIPKIDR